MCSASSRLQPCQAYDAAALRKNCFFRGDELARSLSVANGGLFGNHPPVVLSKDASRGGEDEIAARNFRAGFTEPALPERVAHLVRISISRRSRRGAEEDVGEAAAAPRR